MVRDRRYKAVKALIDNGEITCFNEIFEYIPKTRVLTDLGTQHKRFNRLMNQSEQFVLAELFMLARILEVDDRKMFELVYNQYLQQKERRRRRGKPTV